MTMKELQQAGLFTDEQAESADALVPGWENMTPAEFMPAAADAITRALAEATDTVQALAAHYRKQGES